MRVEHCSGRIVVSFSYAGGVVVASVDSKDGVSDLRVTVKHPDFGVTSSGSVEQAILWFDCVSGCDTLPKQTQGILPL